ncbi:Wac fibritin neck whiskers [Escherichia phage JS10]|uniref:Wac fibritin neck whiskers n=1 Tax=Escherichia phage JS10 TaxID=576790 RepID=C4MZQ1_9CAUD|nr:fibritin neck whisker [Escherichia phage JS10]ACL78382.1 Wac fibritin neck whiskers [Escherichia phage JS10]
MINKLELSELPFVDGVPDAPQKRIQWIREGDCMSAAKTKYGNEGNLNAAALGVQKNVEALDANDLKTADKVNELIENVNNINDALEMSTDISIIQQIEKNRVDIVDLKKVTEDTTEKLDTLTTNFDFLREDVGYHDPLQDGPYLTVRENIVLLKTEIGHYENQDINGNPLPPGETNEATGIKRRIMDNTTELVDHRLRLDTLERNYEDSDVGQLGIKLNEIRAELGPHSDTVGKQPAYTRISVLETAAVNFNTAIDEIKDNIDFSGMPIKDRVTTLESKTFTLENSVNVDLKPRVTSIETQIGSESAPASINGRLSGLRTDVNDLKTVVGVSSSDGLRFQVTDINRRLGSEVSPAAGTINKRLNDVIIQANQSTSSIQDIQVKIGNNQSGIKGTLLKLTDKVDGTNPNGATVEERGLINAVTSLETQMQGKLGDAPSDGKLYARRNAAWAEVVNNSTEIETVKADLVVTDGKVTALTSRVDGNDTSISSLDTRTGALNTSVGEIKADIVSIKAKDDEQDGRLTALESSDVTINGKIAALETKTDTTDDDVTALALDVSSLENQLTPIKADITKNKGDIVALTGRVASTEGEINAIKVDTAKIAPLTTRVTTAEGKITTLETGLAAVKVESDKVAGINTRLSTAEGDIGTLKTGLAEVKGESDKVAAIDTRLGVVEVESGKVAGIDARLGDVEGEVSTLETGLAAVKVESDKVAGINTRLGTVEGKVGTLETGLAAVKVESDKVADLGTRLTAAEGKITALETELSKRPPVAPAADGLPYVLVDNAWVLLSDFVTLNSAP